MFKAWLSPKSLQTPRVALYELQFPCIQWCTFFLVGNSSFTVVQKAPCLPKVQNGLPFSWSLIRLIMNILLTKSRKTQLHIWGFPEEAGHCWLTVSYSRSVMTPRWLYCPKYMYAVKCISCTHGCNRVRHVKEVGVPRTDEREKPPEAPGDRRWSEWTLTSRGKSIWAKWKRWWWSKTESSRLSTTENYHRLAVYIYQRSAKLIDLKELQNQAQVSGSHAFCWEKKNRKASLLFSH